MADEKKNPEGKWGEIFSLKWNQKFFVFDFFHPYVGMGGGWANGKTYALCYKALLVARVVPGIPILLGQITEAMLIRALIPEFARALCGSRASMDSIDEHPSVKSFSRKNLQVVFHNGSSVTFIAVGERNKGLVQVEKLQSTSYGWIGLDQADNMFEGVFDYLQGRNRFRNVARHVNSNGDICEYEFKNQIAITYNPEGFTHWIYKRFLKKDEEIIGSLGHYYKTYEYSSGDACLAPKDQLTKWENMSQDMADRFYHGKWGSFSDQVYKSWDKDIHVIPPFRIPHDWDWYLGFDYGYGAESCFLIFAVSRKCKSTPNVPENICFCVWEHYAKELTPEEHSVIVHRGMEGTDPELEPRRFVGYPADPSIWRRQSRGETIADEYAKNGIYFEPAVNDQFLGVERTTMMLQGRPDRAADVTEVLATVYGDKSLVPPKIKKSAAQLMFFAKPSVEHASEEIPSIRVSEQAYSGARGVFLKEKQKDHAADVVRYFCCEFYERTTPKKVRMETERWRKVKSSRAQRTRRRSVV